MDCSRVPKPVKLFDRMRFFVTTSHNSSYDQILKAQKLAQELGTEYLPKKTAIEVMKTLQYDFYYTVEKERLLIRWADGTFFFHPSSAKMRMRNIKHGQKEYLLEAMQLEGTEKILDLTLGLGSDAILMAAFLTEGIILGLEDSIHIYTIVKEGLISYHDSADWVNESARRIFPVHGNYKTYLDSLPPRSYDMIYCDPMFDHPVMSSSGLNPIRPFANYEVLEEADVEKMRRVATKRIVFKTLANDHLLENIRVDKILGSKNSGILFGVIEC